MATGVDYDALITYGPLGLIIVLMITGRLVPSFVVDRYREELEQAQREIRELRAKLDRRRA